MSSAFAQNPPYQAEITHNVIENSTVRIRSLPVGIFTNPSFESGDLSGWITTDMSAPFVALQASTGGVNPGLGLFTSAPSDGSFSAIHGFDGDGPDTITLAQDVTLPADAVFLTFDYRGAWDLLNYGATQDRVFSVIFEPAGGGAAYESFEIVRASSGDFVGDIGPKIGQVNTDFVRGVPGFDEDVIQHRVLLSTVIYF